eukprot:6184052-Pleurochrysis_carterae.AAC.1
MYSDRVHCPRLVIITNSDIAAVIEKNHTFCRSTSWSRLQEDNALPNFIVTDHGDLGRSDPGCPCSYEDRKALQARNARGPKRRCGKCTLQWRPRGIWELRRRLYRPCHAQSWSCLKRWHEAQCVLAQFPQTSTAWSKLHKYSHRTLRRKFAPHSLACWHRNDDEHHHHRNGSMAAMGPA